MYNAQDTISKVQGEIKRKSDTQKHMLEECGLSVNMLKQMSDKNGIASFSLAKIADYLDCSVDYLLGRTDNPQSHKNGSSMSVENVSGNSGIVGNIVSGSINSAAMNPQAAALLDTFNKLTPVEQAKLLVYADELTNK